MSDKLRVDLWKKLGEDERSFSWFHRTYLGDSKMSYNTFYKQSKGQELTKMSTELTEAIELYTAKENQ